MRVYFYEYIFKKYKYLKHLFINNTLRIFKDQIQFKDV